MFSPPTSNYVERIFSMKKFVVTDQRKRIYYILFEALMFLKANRGFRAIHTVLRAAKNPHPDETMAADDDAFYKYIVIE